MLFKGNSSKLELLIEKIQANKDLQDTLGTEPSLSWNSETADEDGNSLSPSSCETPNSIATDGNEAEISFTIGPTDATPYACQFCDKAFPRLSYLKKHEQSHSDLMPFKCDYCQRLFKHKRSRDRHVKLHTGDKKYRCPHCESAFSRSDHLKIHLKTHDHQKPYQCQVCNRGYNTAAALTSHIQNHKKESVHSTPSPGSFRCLQCNGTFHSGEDLQSHVLQNHRPINSTTPDKPADIISLKRFSSSPKTPSSSPSTKLGRGSAELPMEQSHQAQLNPHSHMLLPFPMTKLACIYCTKDSFTSLEALQLHIQAFHGSLLNGDLGESPHHHISPIPTPSGFASPDSVSSSSGIPCPFCTLKFPTLTALHKHTVTVHSLSGYLQAKAKENAFCAPCAMAFPNSALYAEHFVLFHANNGHHRSKIPVCSPEPLQVKPTDLSKKSKSSSSELPSSSTSSTGISHSGREGGSTAKKLKREENDHHHHHHHQQSMHSSGSSSTGSSASSALSVSDIRSAAAAAAAALAAHSVSSAAVTDNNNSINPIMSLVGGPVLLCSQCNAGFSDFESFRTHLKSHLEEVVQKFVCEDCDSEFNTEDQLESHSMAHYLNTSTEYGCQSCLKLFGKPDELQKHLMDIHAHHLYRCALCKEMFDSKVSIQVHFAVKHSNECKMFRCNSCSNVFRSEIEFQVHVKMVHLRKMSPYRCLLCNSSFPSELDLQFHLSTHQKQFSCKMCDAAFHVEFLLDKHMETHHSSSMVNGSSSSADHNISSSLGSNGRSSMNNSNMKSTGGKKSTNQTLSTSSMGGTKTKELKCDICDKIFGSETELSTHRKQTHHILHSHGNPTDSTSVAERGGKPVATSHKSSHLNHHSSHHTNSNSNANSSNGSAASGNCSTSLSLSCAYCNENCKSRTDLENHMKTHQVVASGKHKCNICDEVCPSATLLAEHKLTHCKVISGTTCTSCKQNISSEEQYYIHLKQHSQTSTPEATVGSTTGGGNALSSSPKSLASLLPVVCIICRQTLMNEIEIQVHSKFHTSRQDDNGDSNNSNNEASPLKSSSKSPIAHRPQAQCCLCFKMEERRDTSGGRNGFSTEPQPFICDDCCQKKTSLALPFPPHFFFPPTGSTSINLSELQRKSPPSSTTTTPEDNGRPSSSNSTMATTPDLKTYQCIKCQMSFASEQEIQAHVVVHLKHEGSSHECHLCNQVSFDSPLKLQCHLIEHTYEGYQSFNCYMCSSVFTTATGLQQHMVQHGLENRIYECSECPLKFWFTKELENHSFLHKQPKDFSSTHKERSSSKRPTNTSSESSSPIPHTTSNNGSGSHSMRKQKRKRFFYRSDDSDEELEPVLNVKVEVNSPVADTGTCGHKLSEQTKEFEDTAMSSSNGQTQIDNQNHDGAV